MSIFRYDHIVRPDCPLPYGSSVVAYCRDSGGDNQDRSVEQQIEAVRDYCTKHRLTLEGVYVDAAKSGSSAEGRSGLNEMLSTLRARFKLIRDHAKRAKQAQQQPFGVIVWKSNRLSRDSIEATHIKSDLRMRGLTILSLVNQGETGDATLDVIIETLQQYQDQNTLKELSENIQRGMAQLISIRDTDPMFRQYNPSWPTQDGRYLGIRPGTVPVGFKGELVIIGVNRRGELREVQRLVPDPETWNKVKLAWELRHNGAGLTEVHRTTMLFKSAPSYTSLFKNRIYAGDLIYSGKVYEGFVPAMIPLEWWEEEQSHIAKRSEILHLHKVDKEHHPRSVSSRHLLTGLLTCCAIEGSNHSMHAESVPARKNRGQWGFYICDKRKNSRGHLCNLPRISAKALESSVINWVLDNLLSVDNLRQVAEDVASQLNGGDAEARLRLDVMQKNLGDTRRAIEHILNMIEASGSSPALEGRLRKREAEERELVREARALKAAIDEAQNAVVPSEEQIAEWARLIRATLTGEDTALIRQTLRALIERIEIYDKDKAKVHYKPVSGHVSLVQSFWALREVNHKLGMSSQKYLMSQTIILEKPERQYVRSERLLKKISEAKRLRMAGHSFSQIGRMFGVSQKTAIRWVNDESA